MKSILPSILMLSMLSISLGCTQNRADEGSSQTSSTSKTYSSIYWSDGDSGRLGQLKFRLANIDAPETGSLKQRGGAKCESERELGYEAKAYIVGFTTDKTIRIIRDYGKDRYDRLVVDLEADGEDIGKMGVEAGHLKDWLHIKGRKQYAKPDWCVKATN